MTTTPVSLLERLRRPADPEAWSRFVALYAPLVYGWGRRVGLQDPDAADLVQDVFTTLVQVLPTFAYDRQLSFRRWLRTVTLNRWRNTRRRRDHRTEPGGGGELDHIASANDLETLWETEYQQHLARQALRIMRADFQETTWRACWEVAVAQRSAVEVAAELGLTVGAVYAAKFRVLERLRQEIEGLLE